MTKKPVTTFIALVATLLLGALFLYTPIASAEVVLVKYRGPVDLAPFRCDQISRSSLVHRVCYDRREHYMLINLQGVYYHYCQIDADSVARLLAADSMGRFFNANIKGRFDCRVLRMPVYKK